ncbi:MAG TPA: hypothetical protein VIN08_13970, partial [Ohtaekwangia sp.]|uniref:hypothetical protein n=1 Tax=Ohtaekwangia sp. TaxID=2066019 RepID=UPI002F92E2DC
YLFTPGEAWIQSMHLTNAEAQSYTETTFSYNAAESKISFAIPATGIQNDKVYKLEILNIPKQQAVLDANVQQVNTELAGGDTLTTKSIEGELAIREIKTVFTSPFRTSKYNTFREKMASVNLGITMTIPSQAGDMMELKSYLQGPELMDHYELEGKDEYAPMITTVALLDNNKWYNQLVYPLVYEGYPLLGYIKTTRDTSLLGLPAVRAAFLEQLSEAPVLTDDAMAIATTTLSGYMRYDLMHAMITDYRSIQQQVANYVVDKPERITDRLNKILTQPFPFYRQGKYYVRLNYRIPGINKTTSSYDWELYNAIPD